MEWKTIILVVIILILLFLVGFMIFNQEVNHENHISVNNVSFTVPSGFSEGALNKNGDINLTNGKQSIFISDYNDSNVTGHMENYIKYCESQNSTISHSNFTIDNQVVYQTINQNTSSKYYWFAKENKSFSIYVWGNSTGVDNLVMDMIKSTEN